MLLMVTELPILERKGNQTISKNFELHSLKLSQLSWQCTVMYDADACIRKELKSTIYFSGTQMLVFIVNLYYDTGDRVCTNSVY